MSTERLRIGEFAAAAGVSPRTVRYYVVEGLLPPPDGVGLGASYGPEHLDRLRLILRLKDAYLPLREIRRQLTGLDDEEVRRRLREIETGEARARGRAAAGTPPAPPLPSPPSADGGSSAADYLRRLGGAGFPVPPAGRATRASQASATPAPPAMSAPADAPPGDAVPAAPYRAFTRGPAPDPEGPSYPGYVAPGSPLTLGAAIPAGPPAAPAEDDTEASPAAEHWVRLRIGDDAELLIRSGAYHRLRDKVDWLVGWARAIFR
jgi:DNA-binding transcriptional MerR regulator